MGNPLFEDVSPTKNGGFPASYVSLPEGSCFFVDLLEVMGMYKKSGL